MRGILHSGDRRAGGDESTGVDESSRHEPSERRANRGVRLECIDALCRGSLGGFELHLGGRAVGVEGSHAVRLPFRVVLHRLCSGHRRLGLHTLGGDVTCVDPRQHLAVVNTLSFARRKLRNTAHELRGERGRTEWLRDTGRLEHGWDLRVMNGDRRLGRAPVIVRRSLMGATARAHDQDTKDCKDAPSDHGVRSSITERSCPAARRRVTAATIA